MTDWHLANRLFFWALAISFSTLSLGLAAFAVSTASGVLFAKFINIFLKEKINLLIGSAGIAGVPMSARVSQMVGAEANPGNYLLMHAMGPNIAGVIGSMIIAGVFVGMLGR